MVALVDRAGEGALLRKAAGPGRIRGIGVELWARAAADRARAGRVVADGLRRARALHSAERRLVGDQLAALVRTGRGLARVLGTEDPDRLWVAALVRAGLPPDEAGDPALASLAADWAALGSDPRERLRWWHDWPDAFAEALLSELGPDEALGFAAASDARAPIDLRVPDRLDREGVRASLLRDGVATVPVGRVGLRVVSGRGVEASAAFREGRVEIQDLGSQHLGDLVGAEPTDVLDLCAGAGGKSLQLAARGHRVVAADPRPEALRELQRRAQRARTPVKAVLADAGDAPELRGRRFDAVLVDAPCSGTGTWRRAPTARWTWSAEAERAHAARQRRLLDRAAAFVAPGGRLVYGTCAVGRAEDEDVVDAFLAAHRGWRVAARLRTWPHRDGTDGFFGAVLVGAEAAPDPG